MSDQSIVKKSAFSFIRRMKLRTVLVLAILFVIFSGGAVSTFVVIWQIGGTILIQAQNRVDQDMNTAWAIYNYELEKIRTVAQMAASDMAAMEALRGAAGEGNKARHNETEAWLQTIKHRYNLDILTLTDGNGVVLARAAPPYNRGDVRRSDQIVAKALAGESVASTEIVAREDLERESAALPARAFMVIEPTPKAKPRKEEYETSGMAMTAAAPVTDVNGNVVGAIYASKLLNRNYEIVDKIKDTVYRGETHRGKDIGAATVFQGDLRIATNVLKSNSQRAIGTRVWSRVHDQTLENGAEWKGRAFVVNDWFITNYSPIVNIDNEIIGILYVGILERKFTDIRDRVIAVFLAIIIVGSAIGVYYSFKISNTVDTPIGRLVEASGEIKSGNLSHRVRLSSFKELERLAEAFNEMTSQLERTINEKDDANREVSRLNHHYIEMLAFVTHELMHPLGILKGYLIMLLDGSHGPLNEKQANAALIMRRNVDMVINMTRTYLHLSRIERGELTVNKRLMNLFDEIVFPIIQDERINLGDKGMTLAVEGVDDIKDVEIHADPTLIHIVFNNLLQNAMKYGREGGKITIGFREGKTFFRFNVKNEGDGVPSDKLEKVFDKFRRLDRHVEEGVKGAGLGLFNSRIIIEKHGGKMWAESVEGKYADFIFSIPKHDSEDYDGGAAGSL